ncbi:aldolase [Micromonospora sp. NPDC048830]|uniref:Cgl0159 family (beta/alpha)8-fold protein n=1 Tax=Micromonospora sp. NPDC048830 TaxID=3364257 RepID=UPI0037104968
MTVVGIDEVRDLVRMRATDPGRIKQLLAQRAMPQLWRSSEKRLMMVAADHPARGALGAGSDALAMANRVGLLDRLVRALAHSGVDGVLGTADVIEDLLLLGALEGKVVIGSMNRGGIANTSFEIDDRFTGYSADAIAAAGLQGGKMLLRIDPEDLATPSTLHACGAAVDDLARHGLMAMIEPFISRRANGRLANDLSVTEAIRAATIAAGLGSTSAYTWLKLPVVADMEALLSSTTMPVLLLGGEVGPDQAAQFDSWSAALESPNVRGLVVGRSMLYPADGDVESAVDAAVRML